MILRYDGSYGEGVMKAWPPQDSFHNGDLLTPPAQRQ